MCEWSARESFVDGDACLLAYLGVLRIAPRYRHRLRVLRGGFEAVRRLLHHQHATSYALTAIGAENHDALRLLGANLPGMPTYRRLEQFSTFALRPRRGPLRGGSNALVPTIFLRLPCASRVRTDSINSLRSGAPATLRTRSDVLDCGRRIS